jgi:hypothetical protein
MDKTFLNLIALFIAAAGLGGALYNYDHSGLYFSYAGENWFIIKATTIAKYKTVFFTGLLALGIIIQIINLILILPERKHSTGFYICLSFIGILLVSCLSYGLNKGSRYYANKDLQPRIVEHFAPMYQSVVEILENKGLKKDQLDTKTNEEDIEKYIKSNHETVDKQLSQIEAILEINTKEKDLHIRAEILKKYFVTNSKQ